MGKILVCVKEISVRNSEKLRLTRLTEIFCHILESFQKYSEIKPLYQVTTTSVHKLNTSLLNYQPYFITKRVFKK